MEEKRVKEKTEIKKQDSVMINRILYTPAMLEMNVLLAPNEIGTNKTKENLRIAIAYFIEGKCISEGYVKPKSVSVETYSSGIIKRDKIEFCVVFRCETCSPVEGTWLHRCKVKSVTKAGIHADVYDDQNNIPATIFVIREHFLEHPLSSYFHSIKENDLITVKVIGTRFELNDPCIEVLGDLMPKTTSM